MNVCYLLQLRHPWERSFCALSAYTMFNRAVKMFFNCTLALATDIKIPFFITCSNTMSFNEVHFEARAIVKDSRASLFRARNRNIAFSLSKCLYRRANFFHGGRHVLKLDDREGTGEESTQTSTAPGRQYGGWQDVQHTEKKIGH